MTLGTEKGETSSNMLTIYPIQSGHCVKGLLMINTMNVALQQDIWFFEKRSSSRNTISYSYGKRVFWDLLFNNEFYLILYSIKHINILLLCSYRITRYHCLEDFGPFHYARLGYPLSLPIGGATATKRHGCNNREMLPMAIFILLDIYDLLKKVTTLEKCW